MKKREAAFRRDSDEITGKAFDFALAKRMLQYVKPYRGMFAISIVTACSSTIAIVPWMPPAVTTLSPLAAR